MFVIRFTAVLLLLTGVSSYKILALIPYPGKSHFLVFQPLFQALAEKGHEVTVLSHFPLKEPPKGYRDLILKADAASAESVDLGKLQAAPSKIRMFLIPLIIAYFGYTTCSSRLFAEPVQHLINSNETYDLIFTELFETDCFRGFAHKFQAPMISLSSSTLMAWASESFANPDNPAYIPVNIVDTSDEMTFFERVLNTVAYIWNSLAYCLFNQLPSNYFARKAFGSDLPDLEDLAANTSIVLVNTHFTYNLPRPFVPGVIEVGGMHIGKLKQLPKNIEKWINESTHGVIYFSLGSMIKGHTFPEEKRQAFLRAFGRLPQRVLWKWENDTMPGQPDNVMIQKWMPQLDILCHPNVKAFISHGGLLGTTEAVHCGVPVVVMPQFGDQHTNAKALEKNGGGVILHLHEADEEKVYNALKKVLDPSFNKQAKELSERFRDRPMPPLETAIYWVEYVARHKGAPHMRTAAVGMPLYKYLLLDVIAFLIAVFTVLSWLAYYITKKAIKLVFRSKEKVKTS